MDEALRTTPAVALGIADRVWSVGDLLDAALATLLQLASGLSARAFDI
jgi:hypothetical protein